MSLIAVFTADPVIVPTLARVAERGGAELVVRRDLSEGNIVGSPLALVVDLELVGVLEAIAGWRAQWPDALLAAFISRPDRRMWEEAIAAGFDLVATRGALARQLEKRLATWRGRPPARRVRLFNVEDVAGRIGVVHRLIDETAGPLAVYHVSGELHAAADACPHAGGQLSLGTLDRAIVTCPLHGSQFDVRTGERMRGPADDPIATFRVVVEGGIAYVEVE